MYANHIWYESENGITLNQYIPNQTSWSWNEQEISLELKQDHQLNSHHRPDSLAYEINIHTHQALEFALKIRLPWWLSDKPEITINGQPLNVEYNPSSYLEIKRNWQQDTIHIHLPKELVSIPLPDEPDMVAFMDGPIVFAGLNPEPNPRPTRREDTSNATFWPRYLIRGLSLTGDPMQPRSILVPDNEREWAFWHGGYRTLNQDHDIRFIPLYEVRNEFYTVYFPIKKGV